MSDALIYLCGPIADRTDADCNDWRSYVKNEWKGQCVDPMRRDYRGVEIGEELAAKIVADDLADINACEGVIVYFDKPSVGTSMEVFYSHVTAKKVVVVVNASAKMLSPWMTNHCDYVALDLADGLRALDELIHQRRQMVKPFDTGNTWDTLNDLAIVNEARVAGEWHWWANPTCKYVDLRVDMRDGACVMRNRHGQRITPQQLAYQYGASPLPPQQLKSRSDI